MKNRSFNTTFIGLFLSVCFLSCNSDNEKSDAYGNFEAVEVIVSSEGQGRIIDLKIEEGDKISTDEKLGQIDTVLLQLQKEEVEANIAALGARVMSIHEQIAVYEAQKKKLLIDKDRLEKLFKNEAATQQQLDNVNSSLAINEKQLEATKRKIKDSNKATMSQYEPLRSKVDLINEQINRCAIISPVKGTVLQKFAEKGEMTSTGKPLYKVADLSTLKVKAYASASQLSSIKVGQKVIVLTDGKEGEMNQTDGTVEWISDKAEFTPKTIQTKEERVSLIYAFKVKVENKDGYFRIGMPAEINFK
ncbi:HlyD family secretion protein [Flammeovirga sp. EKP202]|uniref:HlyD family secretion protein n=1 Tax=Flammeovirga sp. EKP202 TaxID=2770592 RepID=UPI00165FE148|nr:HlyD family efflux transporter periplasmic adaptor subunit [Flammeovirga sp. EKP202]MBD0405044.1 HlyD family efflux transporter periplasmic adaptor subunit [Flammeovirga sp. EKP202]